MPEDLVTVRVAQGELRGKKVPGKAGTPFYSFQGIPYAKPPVGPLRFKAVACLLQGRTSVLEALGSENIGKVVVLSRGNVSGVGGNCDPQPPTPWKGVRDALRDGDISTQMDIDYASMNPKGFKGSEDCLFLNVFAPESADIGHRSGPKLPVMVYIHGGGFVMGSGNSDSWQGPDWLMTENVVFVTFNYRLGVFGFLTLGHPAASGNYGLKDQVMALRWVRENIEVFGGDPGNVTIFGISAGGASVHYHMISPMSNGLFHRAIAQSGCAINPWAQQREAVDNARRLAKGLGCDAENPEEIAAFLRQVDDQKLYVAAEEFGRSQRDRKRFLPLHFVPTVEEDIPGIEPFLPVSPHQLVEDGRHHAVPFITGITSAEGLVMYTFNRELLEESGMARVDTAWEDNVVPETRRRVGAARAADAARQLREFFLGGNALNKTTFKGYVDMFSDLWFGEGTKQVVRKVAETKKAPVYFYYLNQKFPVDWLSLADAGLEVPGTNHGSDMFYLFESTDIIGLPAPTLEEDHPAAVTRRRMVRMWANFARTGNPTPEDDKLLGVRWEPYTEAKSNYLEVAPNLRLGTDLLKERSDFWDNFYSTFVPQRSEAYRERFDFWKKRAVPKSHK